MRLKKLRTNKVEFTLFSERCSFTAQFATFGVLKFPKVRHVHQCTTLCYLIGE